MAINKDFRISYSFNNVTKNGESEILSDPNKPTFYQRHNVRLAAQAIQSAEITNEVQ
jgi:hypothetical protein